MVYKCKICGGATIVDTQSGIATCEYCGTRQALPLFMEDSARLLYESGNNYLMHSEYDKAENVFNQLLSIQPNAAELYWDLVLCKYGVTYVKDPKTGNYVPTCNRTHYTPIFADENYRKAIELAVGEKKALFEADAKTIDTIQKGIIAVSKKEKPFDIFISYKETDAGGNRTKDSLEAQKLYTILTEAGYKVFFSRITLEDKVGVEYEPYIYAALHSSKVMLTVCSDHENLEAVWVKNEWSRFLQLRQSDSAKTLLPLYFDMEKDALPEEFALLPAYNTQQEGFEEELLRGIKKLIPLPIMLAKRRKMIAKTVGAAVAIFAVAAGIAAAIFIPKQLEEKRLAQEQARLASEAAAAEKANAEAYESAMTLFANGDYAAAEAAFVALGDYRDAASMAAKCPIQQKYDAAMQLYYDGNYPEAAWALEALGDYEDAAKRKEQAEISWRKSLASVVAVTEAGQYSITTSGAVTSIATGSPHETYKINEHGKIVSIVTYGNALYEDGTVYSGSSTKPEPYQDIIQITPYFTTRYAMLRADGKVVLSDLDDDSQWYDDAWLAPAADWENIVMLSWYIAGGDEGEPYDFALAGVDKDGNVHLCYLLEVDIWYDEEVYYYDGTIKCFTEHKDAFQNIKDINISVGGDWDGDSYVAYINAIALTKNGEVVSCIDNQLSTNPAKGVVGVGFDGYNGAAYTLFADGTLRKNQSNKAVLKDVVAYSAGYWITRSGTAYELFGGDLFEDCKATVYDEWMTKMR